MEACHLLHRMWIVGAVLVGAPIAWAGGVRIASPAGGPSYATLGAAVASASDGDVLLVGEGIYVESVVLIQGKSLTVIGVGGDPQLTRVSAKLTVRDLPAGGRVHVQGLTIGGGLTLLDCQGLVRVEDCAIFGPSAPFTLGCIGQSGQVGVQMLNAQFASFTRCRITGGNGEDVVGGGCSPPPKAGAGATAFAANLGQIALYDCELEGGAAGEPMGTVSPATGGSGLSAVGSSAPISVFASGCQFQGGDGAAGGGYGAWIDSGTLTHLACTFLSGEPPPAGGPLVGDAVALAGESRSWSATAVVPSGAPFSATLVGVPGDALWALRSATWNHSFAPAFSGVLHVPWPQHLPFAPLGVVPAGGSLQVPLPGVRVPPGQASSLLATQGLVRPASGGVLLSGPHFVLGLAADVGPDCNANGVSDYVDVVFGGVPDANHNLIPDTCTGG